PGVAAYIQNAREALAAAHDAIIESRILQTFYANRLRSSKPLFRIGDLVYLATRNLNLVRALVTKLLPRYIGPYKILLADPE
ncbi:hypothetical protein DL93DRAFT_2030727, partial [Clavulina sp. PMI_390]